MRNRIEKLSELCTGWFAHAGRASDRNNAGEAGGNLAPASSVGAFAAQDGA
jgi:hypothetical protein